MPISLKTINDSLTRTGRLDHRIIGVYGTDKVPAEAVTVSSVIKGIPCLAKTLYKMSLNDGVPPVYVGEGMKPMKDVCTGPLMALGYMDVLPGLEALYSSDSPRPESYCVKKSSSLYAETIHDIGVATPIAKYTVMKALSDIDLDPGHVQSILCFGNATQIRYLMALIHFSEARGYTPIMAPWTPGTCATFVALASGTVSNSPKNTAFIPANLEPNRWLPKDILALSIPMEMAIRMAEGYESSFAVKRHGLAYPDAIENL